MPSATTPRVVLIGHVCIDHNQSEHASYTGWGSSVLYMAQYLHKHTSATPTVISSYGPDVLEYLPDVHLLPAHPNKPQTLIYRNDSRTGKRVQTCHNLQQAGPPPLTAEIIAAIREADIVVVATLLPNYSAEFIREALAYARPDSLKVLCPQGYFRHIGTNGLVSPRDFIEAPQIVPQFDLVLYSEEDYPQALELAQTWKQTIATKVIVTQSKDGATIVAATDVVHIPTTPIPPDKIIDSVGCGDTFAATVTLEYYRSKDLSAAVAAAHKAAAQKLLAVITVR